MSEPFYTTVHLCKQYDSDIMTMMSQLSVPSFRWRKPSHVHSWVMLTCLHIHRWSWPTPHMSSYEPLIYISQHNSYGCDINILYGGVCLITENFLLCMNMLCMLNMYWHNRYSNPLFFIGFYIHFLYVSCFNTCFIFRQPHYGHHGTSYSQKEAVPEDVWVRMSGIWKGINIPLPI